MTTEIEDDIITIIAAKGQASAMDILNGLAPITPRQAITPVVQGLLKRGVLTSQMTSHQIGTPGNLHWCEAYLYAIKPAPPA